MARKSRAKPPSPFLRFNSSPKVIRLVVMMYVRFPLSLRNVKDLLFVRGIDIWHETYGSGGTGSGGIVKANAPPFARLVSELWCGFSVCFLS